MPYDAYTLKTSRPDIRRTATYNRIVEALRTKPMGTGEIAYTIGMNNASVAKHIHNMKLAGIVGVYATVTYKHQGRDLIIYGLTGRRYPRYHDNFVMLV